MKDTFLTTNYKGFCIQSCYDRDLQKEIVTVNNKEFKSYHAAKCYITKVLIPKHDKAMCEFVTKGD